MGNSEVGHLTIGSGRVLFQDLMRVNLAVRDGSIFENAGARGRLRAGAGARRRRAPARARLDRAASTRTSTICSRCSSSRGARGWQERTWIHAFTDGRDVSPHAAAADLAALPAERIATVVGRYYAMDRDNRAERTDRAVGGDPRRRRRARRRSGRRRARRATQRGITDEFIEPIVLDGRPRLDPAVDAAIFFNFRPDRGRQLSRRLLERGVDLTTMTRYAEDIATPVAFAEQDVARHARRDAQRAPASGSSTPPRPRSTPTSRTSSTAARRRSGQGRRAILVPSPRDVPSYDLKPEMSAAGVAAAVVEALPDGYGFCVVNFANPDMVGHTGVIPAVVRAVEAADAALGEVVEATHAAGGVCLVTADHGNAEQMLEADGVSPHTAHTTNPVPLS